MTPLGTYTWYPRLALLRALLLHMRILRTSQCPMQMQWEKKREQSTQPTCANLDELCTKYEPGEIATFSARHPSTGASLIACVHMSPIGFGDDGSSTDYRDPGRMPSISPANALPPVASFRPLPRSGLLDGLVPSKLFLADGGTLCKTHALDNVYVARPPARHRTARTANNSACHPWHPSAP